MVSGRGPGGLLGSAIFLMVVTLDTCDVTALGAQRRLVQRSSTDCGGDGLRQYVSWPESLHRRVTMSDGTPSGVQPGRVRSASSGGELCRVSRRCSPDLRQEDTTTLRRLSAILPEGFSSGTAPESPSVSQAASWRRQHTKGGLTVPSGPYGGPGILLPLNESSLLPLLKNLGVLRNLIPSEADPDASKNILFMLVPWAGWASRVLPPRPPPTSLDTPSKFRLFGKKGIINIPGPFGESVGHALNQILLKATLAVELLLGGMLFFLGAGAVALLAKLVFKGGSSSGATLSSVLDDTQVMAMVLRAVEMYEKYT